MKTDYVNSNLVSLKCVLFLFFGGVGCLLPFLPLHMNEKGLTVYESRIVSIVAPLIAALGPLVAGPLADRLAGGSGGSSRSKTGLYLRVMISVCCILAVIFYWLLMVVPVIIRSPPAVSFTCDGKGGIVFQERCKADSSCYDWDNHKRGSLLVTNCRFTCRSQFELIGNETIETTTIYPEKDVSVASAEEDESYDETHVLGDEIEVEQLSPENDINPQLKVCDGTSGTACKNDLVPHPHMCYYNGSLELCEVYTKYSKPISLFVTLKSDRPVDENDTDDTCKYPVGSDFHCRIPYEVQHNLTLSDSSCIPIIKCDIQDAYNSTGSILSESECVNTSSSFWLYLLIRSIADIFTAAGATLLATAVVIATRETSTGRGDVGKQLAAGALGLGIFAPICGATASHLVSMISFSIMFFMAAFVLVIDSKMPLSPPEWWWHTRCGLLALPMSSIRKYSIETGALAVVLVTLGIFWGAIDAYLPWRLVDLDGDRLLIGVAVMIGALPAVIYLTYAEKIVDYCGHSNILIICFVCYIIHYTGLTIMKNPNLVLIYESLEMISLHLMWVTSILYLRHLVPRKFTATGQAIPIITHFCIGRVFGALIGGYAYNDNHSEAAFHDIHMGLAVSAAIIATFYFVTYQFWLKKYCLAPTVKPPRPAPSVVQSMNGNGSYTPLRVYHNGRAKKGQFRY